MGYQRFVVHKHAGTIATLATVSKPEASCSQQEPATVATIATVCGPQAQTVADVASVAASCCGNDLVEAQTVAHLANVAGYCCEADISSSIPGADPEPPPEPYVDKLESICRGPHPAAIEPDRWNIFLADARQFVSRWSAEADNIGFTPSEMLAFPDATGRAGFVWHLRGRPVISIEGGVFHIGDKPGERRS